MDASRVIAQLDDGYEESRAGLFELLRIPSVSAMPGENAHGPNEWLVEENFRAGMHASAFLWEELAALEAASRPPPHSRTVKLEAR